MLPERTGERSDVTEKAQRPSPVGTWKVLSFRIEFEDSDERDESCGKNPLGYVVITEERPIAVITRPDRAMDATAEELFDSMMVYPSRYRMQGDDCFFTTVDSARGNPLGSAPIKFASSRLTGKSCPSWDYSEKIRIVRDGGSVVC